MERYIKSDAILCMSNERGTKIVRPHHMPFSFYYSANPNVGHSIRVKPIFRSNKFSLDDAGNLELHGDWKYTPGANDKNISRQAINQMKQFFRENFILFAVVWDRQLPESDIQDYLEGDVELSELVADLTFYSTHKDALDSINSMQELEDYCRKHELVNFYGN